MPRLVREVLASEAGEVTITLRIQRLQGGDHVCYKTGLKMPLKSLMLDYCIHVGVVYEKTRFFYDGTRLWGDKTPYELQMEEDDVIEAFVEADAEMENRLGTQKTFISFTSVEEDMEDRPLILVVQNHKKEDVYYKMSRGMPLRTVILDYCKRMDLDCHRTRFLFNDSHLKSLETKTPDQLYMEDYDVLYAFTYNTAGKEIIIFDLEEKEEPIFLRMGSSSGNDDQDVYYKVSRNIPLHWVKLDYCDRRGFVCEDMGLRRRSDGYLIDETESSKELNMKDHDVIDVFLKDHDIIDVVQFIEGFKTENAPQIYHNVPEDTCCYHNINV